MRLNKENINMMIIISLIILGFLFMVLSKYQNHTLFYVGLGLLSAGLTIGLVDSLKDIGIRGS